MCDQHSFSSKVSVLPRDATSALKALLFKPAMTDVKTVWSRQRCFAENNIFIFDDADHRFLSEVQVRYLKAGTLPGSFWFKTIRNILFCA